MVRLSVYPTANPRAGLILGHGAGAGQRSPFMSAAARALASRSITVATFDFPYMAEGRKVPDRAAVLEQTWLDAIAAWHADAAALPLFVGGKSMGGRIASQVAARQPTGIAGLVFLGYPLHPPGRPAQRRDAHLPEIALPMLFVQGTRDAFGTAEEIHELLPRLRRAAVHEVAGGDHSFTVPRAAGVSQQNVMNGIYDAVAAFVLQHAGGHR